MSHPPRLMAATRLDAETFARDSPLGRSLALPAHAGLERCLSFDNSAPLAHTYNRGLAEAHDDSLVVFRHDDLWLGEAPLEPALGEALTRFDLVGVAGNGWRVSLQQAWWLDPQTGTWDHPHLVGQLRHGDPESSLLNTYGPTPAPAALLDGVFLAGRAAVLHRAGLAFDSPVRHRRVGAPLGAPPAGVGGGLKAGGGRLRKRDAGRTKESPAIGPAPLLCVCVRPPDPPDRHHLQGRIITGVPTAVRSNNQRAVALLVRTHPWLRRTPKGWPAASCQGAGWMQMESGGRPPPPRQSTLGTAGIL